MAANNLPRDLRDYLLAALADLPGPPRTYAVHVLESVPRQTLDVFPYIHPRPKWMTREIMVLCSEELDAGQAGSSARPRVFTAAIDAVIYTHNASKSTILYISKVDSTGQALPDAPPPTRTLVSAFVRYFADVRTRPLWFSTEGETSSNQHGTLFVHLFARAQNQYLFPNSSDYKGKRVLSDAQLCKWWRATLGEVVTSTLGGVPTLHVDSLVAAYYVVPGLDRDDALRTLGVAPVLPGKQWVYGHPYNDDTIPFPSRGAGPGITGLIPWLEDDAKSRFLDDLASTHNDLAGVPPPSPRKQKRRKLDGDATTPTTSPLPTFSPSFAPPSLNGSPMPSISSVLIAKSSPLPSIDTALLSPRPSTPPPPSDIPKTTKNTKTLSKLGDLAHISADDYWEQIAFRQECSQGAITGFYVMVFGDKGDGDSASSPSRPTIAQNVVARVRQTLVKQQEFCDRERAIRSTGIVEELVKGLLCGPAANGNGANGQGEPPSVDGDGGVYLREVFGTCRTTGAAVAARSVEAKAAAPVTVLAVRRKRKA